MTRHAVSPFVVYLQDKDVFPKLIENNHSYMSCTNTVGGLSRCFNNLPNKYGHFTDLLYCLHDAMYYGELDRWFDLAICIALEDLFDKEGNLYPDIVELLGRGDSDHQKQPDSINTLMAHFGERQVKAHILSGYLNLLSDIAINTIIKEMMSQEKGALYENSPLHYFSKVFTSRVDAITTVDAKLVRDYQNKIRDAVFHSWPKSAELRHQLVACHGRDVPSITETVSTLFSFAKRQAGLAISTLVADEPVSPRRSNRVMDV